MIRRRIQLTVASLLLSAQAMGGAVLESMTTEYTQIPPILGTVLISTLGNASRIEISSISSNESASMIYDGDKRELIAIDHQSQEYFVIDQAMMEQMAARVSDSMQQMRQALEAMPPEQRALAEQMMRRQLPPADAVETPQADLQKTGARDTIGGYACEYYDVVQEGRKIRELCMTRWSDFQEGRKIAAALMQLADFFDGMRKAFAGTGELNVMDRQQEMFVYMEELDGYPVLSRDYDAAGNLELESRLQSAGAADISPELFEPPRSYQRQSM